MKTEFPQKKKIEIVSIELVTSPSIVVNIYDEMIIYFRAKANELSIDGCLTLSEPKYFEMSLKELLQVAQDFFYYRFKKFDE